MFFLFPTLLQVESVGRNRHLEALGYIGKQSHWIRCESCLANGGRPRLAPLRTDTGSADGLANEPQGAEANGDSAPWEKGQRGDKSSEGVDGDVGADGAAQPGGEEGEGSSESESDSDPEPEPKPKPMPFHVALTLLRGHPAAKAAFLEPRCAGNRRGLSWLRVGVHRESSGCSLRRPGRSCFRLLCC